MVGAIWAEKGKTIMEALRLALESRQVRWTGLAATSASHTIVILTEGAVSAGSVTAQAIVNLLQVCDCESVQAIVHAHTHTHTHAHTLSHTHTHTHTHTHAHTYIGP